MFRSPMHAALPLILFLLAGCATGGRNLSASIDALMKNYDGEVPGASVLVSRHGKPLVRASYGFADLENRVAANSTTNYRLASLTKQFTAASILLLADDGRLGLDDPVRRWLPSLPSALDGVTIRHLLTHTSGIVDYEDLIPDGTTVQVRDADVLRLLEADNRTLFAPGSTYRYSNSGYALLALIVEQAAGSTFATFLRDRIFQPLGMTQTVAFEEGLSTITNRAYGYSFREGTWIRNDQSITSAVLGDGGIYTSIDDLARWDAALAGERVLRSESIRLSFTPATATDDPDVQYGFGWRISGPTVWHSGETRGFRNVIVRNRDTGLTVAILTNRNESPPRALALAIASLLDDGS